MKVAAESWHQVTLARYLDAAGLVWCHVPNGGRRGKREAVELRMSGVKAGVPDVLVFTPALNAPKGCALELKALKGTVSAEQRVWLEQLAGLGWAVIVAYGYEDAITQLKTIGYDI